MKFLKTYIWNLFTSVDSCLKFPNLKGNSIGVQLGFDMAFPVTSDLFTMHKRINENGKIIGIDPDPNNHILAQQVIIKNKFNIDLIQKGTFSKKDKVDFLLGEKSSWNQLEVLPKDSTVSFSGNKVKVEIDTLDNIIATTNIDIQKIAHINLTINGSEYDTLLGAKKTLKEINDLSLTIIAGRYDESGTINGINDYEAIIPLLHQFGFQTKFKRIHQLFWWGFVTKLIMNRKWIFNQPNFGVIMACKGNHKIKWYQSFS